MKHICSERVGVALNFLPKEKGREFPIRSTSALALRIFLFAGLVSIAGVVCGESSPPVIKADFKVLGGWKFVEGKTALPDVVKKLDGKVMEFKGFMMPINEVEKIKRFILIQSLWGCCFGQAPEPNHLLVVTMKEGKTTPFLPDTIRVIGKFSIGETREEGYLVSIYQVEADQVLSK